MQDLSIKNVDLNLLKIFRVLAEERKTVLAAERLNMTQPAVSRALARMREQLGDPLFVRTQHGLKPTDKGAILCEKLPAVLDELEQLLATLTPLDPYTYKGTMRIAINPFLSLSLPALLHLKLQALAPNLKLEVENWNSSTLDKLKTGALDFAINYELDGFSKEIIATELAKEKFQILVRKGHPLEGQKVSLKQLSAFNALSVIVPGWNDRTTLLQQVLEPLGIAINTVFRSESIFSLAEVAAQSDAIFPASNYLSSDLFPQLQQLHLQDDVEIPQKAFAHYQHYRFRHSPLHNWVKDLLVELVN